MVDDYIEIYVKLTEKRIKGQKLTKEQEKNMMLLANWFANDSRLDDEEFMNKVLSTKT